MVSLYKELSKERKALQEKGELPEWYTTAGWQMFKTKYAVPEEKEGVKSRFETIASTLAAHIPDKEDYELWKNRFFDLLWSGDVSASSPMLANTGTDRGCSVSCSGSVVGDSVYDFYESRKEIALLTKEGFGTSSYLGGIRPRGALISKGGKASGTLPVLKGFVQDMRDVAQG